jgi:hypothetical protein
MILLPRASPPRVRPGRLSPGGLAGVCEAEAIRRDHFRCGGSTNSFRFGDAHATDVEHRSAAAVRAFDPPIDAMHAFTDDKGRVWRVKLELTAVLDVRIRHGVELASIDPDGYAAAFDALLDDRRLALILWTLCRPQAVWRGVGPAEFAGSLRPRIDAAAEALIDEMIRVAPPYMRGALARVFNVVRTGRARRAIR